MKAFLERHPDLSTWGFLSLAFLAALAWSAREVDLAARQWATLTGASVLTAGLCAWILSWEQEDDESEDGPIADSSGPAAAAEAVAPIPAANEKEER